MVIGRRERNKEVKRERILAAATALLAERSLDEVTTQQIADAADIGAGTLFLYARNKGELLLMVQNAHYAQALAEGVVAAASEEDPTDAVMAIVTPIAACNRVHADNGRTYLREVMFGDPAEPHRRRALEIISGTELHLEATLRRVTACDLPTARTTARAVTSLMLRSLAAPQSLGGEIDQILGAVRGDVASFVALVGDRRRSGDSRHTKPETVHY